MPDPNPAVRVRRQMSTRLSSSGLLFGLLLTLLAACGGGGGGTDPPIDPPGTIGPNGGTVRSANNQAGVTVPSGSLTREIVITITPVATPADLRAVGAIGQAYRFAPDGQQFSKLVTVDIFISNAALTGIDRSTISMYASDGLTAGMVPAGIQELSGVTTSPATDGLTVRGLISHFSVISVTGDAAPSGPSASAGVDQTLTLGGTVNLSGSGSTPGGGAVTLAWTFVTRPAGSAATLTGATTGTPSFVPDVAGTYELRLTVTNSTGQTATDTVRITVNPSTSLVPIANAGVDQLVDLGAIVTLQGSATGTPAPTLAWQFVAVPAGGGPPALNNPTTGTPVFIPSRGGVYIIELTATNTQGSDKDSVRVTVNAPPVVGISAPLSAIVGQAITLGSAASDPDGDALTQTFTLITRPTGSTAVLSGNTFTPDVVGTYVVQLSVSDGRLTRTVTATILVVPN
ncbi:MAG: PKD domain-containing protein, partial [Gemmatimonadota bacterium]